MDETTQVAPTLGDAPADAAPAAQAPEAKTPEAAPETDYKALYAAEKAAWETERVTLRKQAERIRSEEIGLLKQADRDARLDSMAESQRIIAEALASGETAELPKRLAEAEARRMKVLNDAAFTQQATALFADIEAAGKDAGVDPNTAAEFEQARLYWNRGVQAGDLVALQKAVTESERAVRRVQAAKGQKAIEDAQKQAQQAIAKARIREDADLDIGKGAGAPHTETLQELAKKDTRRMNAGELAEHDRKMTALMLGKTT